MAKFFVTLEKVIEIPDEKLEGHEPNSESWWQAVEFHTTLAFNHEPTTIVEME